MKSIFSNQLSKSLKRLASITILAGVTSSCSTSREVDPSTHIAPKISRGWVKVISRPPTWYPRGVPADHPTDYRSGDWIYLKDAADTRFFLPHHGLLPDKRKALKAEAMAARHPGLIKNDDNEYMKGKAKAAGGGFLLVIGDVILRIFTMGMGGLY